MFIPLGQWLKVNKYIDSVVNDRGYSTEIGLNTSQHSCVLLPESLDKFKVGWLSVARPAVFESVLIFSLA